MGFELDYQLLFNIALTLAAFFAGRVSSNITKTVQRLDDDVRAMPVNYVSKVDHQVDIARIETAIDKGFDRLLDKLDRKTDR